MIRRSLRNSYEMGLGRSAGILLLLIATLASACSWDNDDAYAASVRAGFILVRPSLGGDPSILRVEGDQITPNWNGEYGYGTLNFSDFAGKDETLWLSSGNRKEIKEINLKRNKIEHTFETGSLAPHFLAIGEKHIIFSDSAQHKLGFLLPKKRTVQGIDIEGRPGRIIYNSGKIYVQLDSTRIALYNEQAMALVQTFEIGKPIVDFRFNRQFQVEVTAGTPGDYYLSTIEANGDFIVRNNTSVNWHKRLHSPYFSQRFETEFLETVELKNDGRLQAGGITTQTADNMEVSFFDSKLYFSRNDSLFYYDMNRDTLLSAQPFAWNMQGSWFWIGAN